MTDKIEDSLNNTPETSETGQRPEVQKSEETAEYRKTMWRGRIPIWICETCERQFEDEERIIMHVLNHYKEDEQEQLLTRLLKEYENDS